MPELEQLLVPLQGQVPQQLVAQKGRVLHLLEQQVRNQILLLALKVYLVQEREEHLRRAQEQHPEHPELLEQLVLVPLQESEAEWEDLEAWEECSTQVY